jgi:hypothetical protein
MDVDEAVGSAACPALTTEIKGDANHVPTTTTELLPFWLGLCKTTERTVGKTTAPFATPVA